MLASVIDADINLSMCTSYGRFVEALVYVACQRPMSLAICAHAISVLTGLG